MSYTTSSTLQNCDDMLGHVAAVDIDDIREYELYLQHRQ